MKYMSFPASCSYAGVANMLECWGLDTEDRDIALEMKLPYLFSWEGGAYLAGPMLQSAEWFDLYLRPHGFHMEETQLPAEALAGFLGEQRTAMLGIRMDHGGKHAVVYQGREDGKLVFLNNKWREDPAPEILQLTEGQLLKRLDEMVTVAVLCPVPESAADLDSKMAGSIPLIRRNVEDICALCQREETVGLLRARRDSLFRALLLDEIAVLRLAGQEALADRFAQIQGGLLEALRQDSEKLVKLSEYISMEELVGASEELVALIQEEMRGSLR